jgi:hypothetical protein
MRRPSAGYCGVTIIGEFIGRKRIKKAHNPRIMKG